MFVETGSHLAQTHCTTQAGLELLLHAKAVCQAIRGWRRPLACFKCRCNWVVYVCGGRETTSQGQFSTGIEGNHQACVSNDLTYSALLLALLFVCCGGLHLFLLLLETGYHSVAHTGWKLPI